MNLDQLERDATEALASYPNGSCIVMDTRDVLKLTALAASHQRLKEALENMLDHFQFTDESPGQYDAVKAARAALRSAP